MGDSGISPIAIAAEAGLGEAHVSAVLAGRTTLDFLLELKNRLADATGIKSVNTFCFAEGSQIGLPSNSQQPGPDANKV